MGRYCPNHQRQPTKPPSFSHTHTPDANSATLCRQWVRGGPYRGPADYCTSAGSCMGGGGGKAKRIGNWSLSNGIGNCDGIIGIRGNRTISPWNVPVKIMVASRKFPVIILTIKRVPLHNLGGFELWRRRIIGEPIFDRRLYGGITSVSREFRNSVGILITLS